MEQNFDTEPRMDQKTFYGSQFRELTEASPDGVVVIEGSGRILFANLAAGLLFDTSVEELEGTIFGYPVLGRDRSELDIGLHHVEMRVARSSWDGQQAFVTSLRDVTKRVQAEADLKSLSQALEDANQELQRLATLDPLTETLNRRGIEKALWNELSRDQRSGSHFVAILLTCDDLRAINDNLGQGVVDVLLKVVAERVRPCFDHPTTSPESTRTAS